MEGATKLQIAHWTDDPAQREEFLTRVGPKIDKESGYMARRYRVATYSEDIATQIRTEFLQQMNTKDLDGPFTKDSAREAADSLLEKGNFRIHERARTLARKIDKRQSRQADVLAEVCQPELPPSVEQQLLGIAQSIQIAISQIPDFTARDSKIFRLETLRLTQVDDLDAPMFEQAAKAAGVSVSEARAHIEYHEQQGHLSPSDRKAWSRARAKVLKAYSRVKFASLLVILLALSLPLYSGVHQSRSVHQNAVAAHQSNFSHQEALAVHQTNFVHQETLAAHQTNFVHQNALA
jgi:hypothetical protein